MGISYFLRSFEVDLLYLQQKVVIEGSATAKHVSATTNIFVRSERVARQSYVTFCLTLCETGIRMFMVLLCVYKHDVFLYAT